MYIRTSIFLLLLTYTLWGYTQGETPQTPSPTPKPVVLPSNNDSTLREDSLMYAEASSSISQQAYLQDTTPSTLPERPPKKSAHADQAEGNRRDNRILLVRHGKLMRFFVIQPEQLFEMNVEDTKGMTITIDQNGNEVITVPKETRMQVFYTGLTITDTARDDSIVDFGNKKINISYSNKDQYFGTINNGRPDGEGKITFNNGDVYIGEVTRGRADGFGVYYDNDLNTTYRGNFRNGSRNGIGALYQGPIQDSVLIYEGNYLDDFFHGRGKFYENGRLRYEGTFLEGEFHGVGKLYDVDGELEYEGEFYNGKKEGKGVQYTLQGKYEGRFQDDKYSGKGVFIYNNGDQLNGSFQEGQIEYGEVTYANGDTYKGELSKGLKHGKGIYTTTEGDVYYGKFEAGELVSGTCIFENGTKYEGDMENWRFHGQGKYVYPDGSYIQGEFKQGKFCEGYEYKMKKNGEVKKKNRKITNC